MNITEFAALKVGDKIDNPMSQSAGTIVETTESGVRVVWGERHGHETRFFYSAQSTAWTHWTRPETPREDAAMDDMRNPDTARAMRNEEQK